MIAAGRLRHRLLFQRPGYTYDPETNAQIAGWEDIGYIYCEVAPLSARELIAAQAEDSEVTLRVVIRHRSDINNKCRILFRDKILNIHGVQADQISGLEYLTLPCSEGLNDG